MNDPTVKYSPYKKRGKHEHVYEEGETEFKQDSNKPTTAVKVIRRRKKLLTVGAVLET
jgi:hypothetical protein